MKFSIFYLFTDGKLINKCSGIIIECDGSDNSAIVLTSSQIIATKVSFDNWEDNNVYAPNAKVKYLSSWAFGRYSTVLYI